MQGLLSPHAHSEPSGSSCCAVCSATTTPRRSPARLSVLSETPPTTATLSMTGRRHYRALHSRDRRMYTG